MLLPLAGLWLSWSSMGDCKASLFFRSGASRSRLCIYTESRGVGWLNTYLGHRLCQADLEKVVVSIWRYGPRVPAEKSTDRWSSNQLESQRVAVTISTQLRVGASVFMRPETGWWEVKLTLVAEGVGLPQDSSNSKLLLVDTQ